MNLTIRARSKVAKLKQAVSNCCLHHALTVMIGTVFSFSFLLSLVLSHMSQLSYVHSPELQDMSLRMLEPVKYSGHSREQAGDDRGVIFDSPNGRNLTGSLLHLVVNPKYACPEKQEIDLVVCVISAPPNFDRRSLIRRTWGHRDARGHRVEVTFILGRPKDDRLLLDIDRESNTHGDIVLGDFTDHYKNLTIKSVLAFSWATTYCRATFLLKVDDDVLVNMFTLRQFIANLRKHNDTTDIVFCTLQVSSKPYRRGKYAVTFWEFPGRTYPSFCSGPAYFMSSSIAHSIYKRALNRPMFRLEDVYLTGFLRHELGIRITQGYQAYANKRLIEQTLKKPFLIFGHSQNNTSKFENLWSSMLKERNSKSGSYI